MDFRNKIFCCKSDFTFFTYIILLSTILTFYIRSSDLNHHTAQSLCPFVSLCLFPLLSHPQPLETTFYSVFLWVRLFCFSKVPHVSDTMPHLSFSVWLNIFRVHPCCHNWQDFLLSQGWRLFYVYTTSVHPLTDT